MINYVYNSQRVCYSSQQRCEKRVLRDLRRTSATIAQKAINALNAIEKQAKVNMVSKTIHTSALSNKPKNSKAG